MKRDGKIRRFLRTGAFWVAVTVGTLGGLAFGVARHEVRKVASYSLDGMAFGLVTLSAVEGFRSQYDSRNKKGRPPSP